MDSALGAGTRDDATLAVLVRSGAQQAALLEILGDKEEAQELNERLELLAPPDAPTKATRLALH